MKTNRSADRAERRLVYMSVAQLRALKTQAKRLGTTQAALLTRGIDLAVAEAGKSRKVSK